MSARPAAFLDRDGVLIEEVGHLRSSADLRLLPGVVPALRRLATAGYLLIVVTNQSAVARGLLSEDELAAIHDLLRGQLAAQGVVLDDVLYCPHHPTEGVGQYRRDCGCRKPAPGMLLAACARHPIDLPRSIFVGDKRSDVAAAHRAGCRGILVRTGHGAEEAAGPFTEEERPALLCADLAEAVAALLAAPRSADLEGRPLPQHLA